MGARGAGKLSTKALHGVLVLRSGARPMPCHASSGLGEVPITTSVESCVEGRAECFVRAADRVCPRRDDWAIRSSLPPRLETEGSKHPPASRLVGCIPHARFMKWFTRSYRCRG